MWQYYFFTFVNYSRKWLHNFSLTSVVQFSFLFPCIRALKILRVLLYSISKQLPLLFSYIQVNKSSQLFLINMANDIPPSYKFDVFLWHIEHFTRQSCLTSDFFSGYIGQMSVIQFAHMNSPNSVSNISMVFAKMNIQLILFSMFRTSLRRCMKKWIVEDSKLHC